MSKINGSHKDDALGGIPKQLQVPSIPSKDGNNDAQLIAELASRHQHKKDSKFGDPVPSGTKPASAETTRRNRQPGVLPPGANQLPASATGIHHNKREKDLHGADFSKGGQGRTRPASSSVEQAVARPLEELRESKKRQFRNGNCN